MLVLLPVALLAYSALPAGSSPVRGAPKCRIFPKNNHWNIRVDQARVHPRSAQIIAAGGRF